MALVQPIKFGRNKADPSCLTSSVLTSHRRIIDASAHKLGIAPEKIVATVDRHGNTSAASIPLALADAVADRRIKRGDLVLLEAMGGGFTWGAALVRW